MAASAPLNVVILAAGKGTRMRSARPKVLHEAAGLPLLAWVIRAAQGLKPEHLHLVVGPETEADAAQGKLPGQDAVTSCSVQAEHKGTGHAVAQAKDALQGATGYTLVLYADTPLVTTQALTELVADTLADGADLALSTFETGQPNGYGRVILDAEGRPSAIVEERDATAEQRALTLCNGGLMLVRNAVLFDLLGQLRADNAAGELYMTDVVALAREAGLKTRAARLDQALLAGVNCRADLAAVEAQLQQRLRAAVMDAGVTLIAPETVTLCHDTVIGADTVVEPNVFFGPAVSIGTGCRLRAGSYFEGASVGEGVIIGPMARLREGSQLDQGVKVGNFVEIKKAHLAAGAKAPHLTYVGDAKVGERANLGAGTITCNYDGVNKHQTTIGPGAFIGSNAALVAPVSIGTGAIVGAGSTVTEDVANDAIITTRAPARLKAGAAERYRNRLRQLKARRENGGG